MGAEWLARKRASLLGLCSGVEVSFVAQLIACVAVLACSLVMTAVVLWLTLRFSTLRVCEFDERAGLDVSLHNEQIGH